MSSFARVRSLLPRATRLTYQSAFNHSRPVVSSNISRISSPLLTLTKAIQSSYFSTSARRFDPSLTTPVPNPVVPEEAAREDAHPEEETKHAVVSTFDLFSIGIGPSSR